MDPNEGIKCASLDCMRVFHYQCAGLRESVFNKMSQESKAKWYCLKCKGAKQEQKSSSVNTKQTIDMNQSINEDFQGFSAEDILKTVNAKLDIVRTISSDLESLKKISNEIKDSQEFLSKQYDKFEDSLKCLPKMEEELRQLKAAVTTKDKQIMELTMRVNQLEQYGRNKNLEINEVSEVNNENVEDLVRKIAEKAGVQLKEEDIEIAHRLPKQKLKIAPLPLLCSFQVGKFGTDLK